jgi:hypothetical protein
MVRTGNMSTNDPSDAGLVLVKETGKALAVTVDCNGRYVHADPYVGAMIAVSEAARNIACSGGEPCGVTNCLNFGNPYDPEVYWQFANVIKGMGEACRAFDDTCDRRQRELLQPDRHREEATSRVPHAHDRHGRQCVPTSSKRMSLDFKEKGTCSSSSAK